MGPVVVVIAMALGLAIAASCAGGDDGERKRAEAAQWCEVTDGVDALLGSWASHIPYDTAAEWVDFAPEEIRPSTERAARILRELATDPPNPELAEAREQIGVYAAEYCPAPARCIADVEENPTLPCIHPIEARSRR